MMLGCGYEFEWGVCWVEKKRLTKNEYLSLVDKIIQYDRAYFVDHQPLVSDIEYDIEYKKLLDYEEGHSDDIVFYSPTQRVGEAVDSSLPSYSHQIPLLSMSNTYNQKELQDFDYRIQKIIKTDSYDYVVEFKLDGLAVNLWYDQGQLQRAAMRGNGFVGDDVTAQVKTIRSIPLTIDYLGSLEIRGEVYMNKLIFKDLNQMRKKEGLKPMATPRHAAAGSLKQLDPLEVSNRRLSFCAYGIEDIDQLLNIDSYMECVNWLKKSFFSTNSYVSLCSSIDEVYAVCEEQKEKRFDLDYDIDGVVIKINSLKQREQLGATVKVPRWQIAYKYPAQGEVTRLREITIQVGRTGRLVPVAELDPIQIDGTCVSRATLHNEDFVNKMGCRPGDLVLVERGGEVIPKIVQVVQHYYDQIQSFRLPENCPSCGEKTLRKESEEHTHVYCSQVSCPAQMKNRVIHFCSKTAMDIDSLGEKLIDSLLSSKKISHYLDLYSLSFEDLNSLPLVAEKLSNVILDKIKESKRKKLSKVLWALGIPLIGQKTSELIASHFGSRQNMMEASPEEWAYIYDIGHSDKEGQYSETASSIKDFIFSKEGQCILDRLEFIGFQLEEDPPSFVHDYVGKGVFFDGTFMKYSKRSIIDQARHHGLKVYSISRTSLIAKKEVLSSQFLNSLHILVRGMKHSTRVDLSVLPSHISVYNEVEFYDLMKSFHSKERSFFYGKSVVLTGVLQSITRKEAEQLLSDNGAHIKKSMSVSIDFLIAGEKCGSKLEKAKKLGVQIMYEDDFVKNIKK